MEHQPLEDKTDAELVHLARAGNRDAFGELIRRHQRGAWSVACVLVHDRFEAEDLAQEAFLRAWRNLDLLIDPAKFGAWLRRIVFGVSVDWLRVFRPDLYRSTEATADLESITHAAQTEPILERLQPVELRQRLESAIENLPSRYRLPLTLFHLDGLSYNRVAEALNIPASTARSLVARARQKMQPVLASYAAEILPDLEDLFREQRMGGPAMLHITDGESVAGTLRESGIPGVVAVYGDLMYEGPAPAGLDGEAWRETRARFLAGGDKTLDEARRYLKNCDDALAAYWEHDETVIWMDHRLSDQLILIKVLDWFAHQDLGQVKLSLICVGHYSGVDRFIGLGQLNASQLMSLADTRLAVREEQFRVAQAAWTAFTSADPRDIEQLIDSDTSALPFLAAAPRRHLEQLPSADNGLSRTEQQLLAVLNEHGHLAGPRLYVSVQRTEDQIFMGHESFNRIVASLASVRHPLVAISGDLQSIRGEVAITQTGREVLVGHADHIELNGIDRWLGGVHLRGGKAAWRWDRASGRIVAG